MMEISYSTVFLLITGIWILTRGILGVKKGKIEWKRELLLMTVYICFVVLARIVYFPMRPVNGKIAPLVFDAAKIIPFRLNLVPLVNLFEVYDGWLINIIGNVTMFIPVGICWPLCFKRLNNIGKAVLACAGLSLFIEVTQLFFYDRCSDVDDLIMNTFGGLLGVLVYFGIARLRRNA